MKRMNTCQLRITAKSDIVLLPTYFKYNSIKCTSFILPIFYDYISLLILVDSVNNGFNCSCTQKYWFIKRSNVCNHHQVTWSTIHFKPSTQTYTSIQNNNFNALKEIILLIIYNCNHNKINIIQT